ncbi:ABC transporter substrate-binding protein [Alicyclobacillus kakegawensis]|uniref:ABC transporter substrate-binding protein n=1 Tax=Alicyclobacillus kakegawensis TaxID=392012 RepID=UPI000836745C|nr:sugar ABC transporter substrate-binding protein [Alicyclobacillus kakegawensis]
MKLRLLSRAFDGFERSFNEQIRTFKELHQDVEIEVDFIEISELERRVVYGEDRNVDYDVLLANTDWLPALVRDRKILCLDTYLKNVPERIGWPSGWSPSMLSLQTFDEKTFGVPYHDGPQLFMYRKDLFFDSNERKKFKDVYGYDLSVPKTWSQFADIAKFFTRPEQGLWGTLLAGFPDSHNIVYDFLIQLWSRGGEFLRDRKAAFNDEVGLEALKFYIDLAINDKVVPPNFRDLDSVASGEYFASGHVAMMWNWSGFAAVADSPTSKVKGQVACTHIPRGDGPHGKHVSLNVYWVLTIPSSARNPDASWQFIQHCMSPEMDKVTSMAGGNGTRLSTWRDSEVQAQYPYYKVIEDIHKEVRSTPSIPEYPLLADILNDMMVRALNGLPAQDCLNWAENEINRILQTK